MEDESKIIYNSQINDEDLEAAKEWLVEQGEDAPDDDRAYQEAWDQKERDWDDLTVNFREYDRKHPDSTYLIKGRRVTSPSYAAYIGAGGEFVPVKVRSFEAAVLKCTQYGDYWVAISESPDGTFEITTCDHDGHNEFEIYRVEKRRYNINFRKEIWGCTKN